MIKYYIVMDNPFKFGTIVSEDFFTNRALEYDQLSQIITSCPTGNGIWWMPIFY